jgi:hypothetical protein
MNHTRPLLKALEVSDRGVVGVMVNIAGSEEVIQDPLVPRIPELLNDPSDKRLVFLNRHGMSPSYD